MNKVLQDLYKCVVFDREAARQLRLAITEIERLLAGDFTEEEFQNLCHNFSEDDATRHAQGCLEYHKKLFGKDFPCLQSTTTQQNHHNNNSQ
jgi:hypothetical protein